MTTPIPEFIPLVTSTGYQSLLNGRPRTCGMRSGHVSLKPGESCGVHSTGAHEETLVFLEGAGAAQVQGKDDVLVSVGAVLYVPPHTEHNLIGGAAGLRYVYVVSPVLQTDIGH